MGGEDGLHRRRRWVDLAAICSRVRSMDAGRLVVSQMGVIEKSLKKSTNSLLEVA